MSLVQKGGFIKAQEQDLWAERSAQDHEERLVIYYGVGGGKVQGKFPVRFSYAKKDFQDSGLAIVRLRLF